MLLYPGGFLGLLQADGSCPLVLPARLGQGRSEDEGEGGVCGLLPALTLPDMNDRTESGLQPLVLRLAEAGAQSGQQQQQSAQQKIIKYS